MEKLLDNDLEEAKEDLAAEALEAKEVLAGARHAAKAQEDKLLFLFFY
jgi:hypothetical protein